jgi:hypothetical protein
MARNIYKELSMNLYFFFFVFRNNILLITISEYVIKISIMSLSFITGFTFKHPFRIKSYWTLNIEGDPSKEPLSWKICTSALGTRNRIN